MSASEPFRESETTAQTLPASTTIANSNAQLQQELRELQATFKQMVEQNRIETDMLLEANASSETRVSDLEMQLRQLLEQDSGRNGGLKKSLKATMEDSQSTALTELTDLSEQSGATWNSMSSGVAMMDTSERSRRGSMESSSSAAWVQSPSYRMDRRASFLERAMSSSLRSLNLETANLSSPSESRQGSSRVLNDSYLNLTERVSSLRLHHQRHQQPFQMSRHHRRQGSNASPDKRRQVEETSLEEKLMNKLALVQLMHGNELEQLQRQLEHHASAISSLEEALVNKNRRMEQYQMDLGLLQRERDALRVENERLLRKVGEERS